MPTKTSLAIQIKTTPAMVLSSEMLRLAGSAIEEAIAREVTDNPALELRERITPRLGRSFKPVPRRSISDEIADVFEDSVTCIPAHETAIDQLAAQARLAAQKADLDVVEALVRSLDSHGFLKADPDELSLQLAVPRTQIERAVRVLHSLDPTGIGARNAQECLLMQCAEVQQTLQTKHPICEIARQMIALAWDDFIHQRNDRLACALDITVEMVEEACSFIRAYLHPYPLQLVVDSADDAVILTNPDLIVHRLTNPDAGRVGFTIEIPAAEQFELRLSDHLEYVPQPITAEDRMESSRFEKLDRAIERARTFIDALNYRWHTLQLIGDFLAGYQAEFFEHGPRCLKPLTRADLAVALGVHESTISRAISDKTIQLPDGRLMLLSGLFDASLAPKEAIRHILASANHMLSDREISSCLHDQGIFLARRTVAKYRRQIGLSKRNRSQALTASTARRPR